MGDATWRTMGCGGSEESENNEKVVVEEDKPEEKKEAAPVSVEPGSKEFAARLFKRLDTDGDGKLSLAELKVVFGDFQSTSISFPSVSDMVRFEKECGKELIGVDEKEWMRVFMGNHPPKLRAKYHSLVNKCLDDGTIFPEDLVAACTPEEIAQFEKEKAEVDAQRHKEWAAAVEAEAAEAEKKEKGGRDIYLAETLPSKEEMADFEATMKEILAEKEAAEAEK